MNIGERRQLISKKLASAGDQYPGGKTTHGGVGSSSYLYGPLFETGRAGQADSRQGDDYSQHSFKLSPFCSRTFGTWLLGHKGGQNRMKAEKQHRHTNRLQWYRPNRTPRRYRLLLATVHPAIFLGEKQRPRGIHHGATKQHYLYLELVTSSAPPPPFSTTSNAIPLRFWHLLLLSRRRLMLSG